jgi:hypothetical protein
MKRRPILVLLLLFACAALVQAFAAPARSPRSRTSNSPAVDGYVCTACGPIPTGGAPASAFDQP